MFVELDPGSTQRAAGQARLDAPGRQHAARRQPRRGPLAARRRHARLPAAAVDGAGEGLQGQRRRPARGLPPLRADAPRPGARQRHGRRSATSNLRRLIHSAQRPQRRARATRATTSRASSTPPSAVFRSFATEDKPTSRSAVGDLPGDAAPDDRHARPRSRRVRRRRSARRRATCARPSRALDRANQRGAARSPRRRRRSCARRSGPFVRDARPVVRSLQARVDTTSRPRRRT